MYGDSTSCMLVKIFKMQLIHSIFVINAILEKIICLFVVVLMIWVGGSINKWARSSNGGFTLYTTAWSWTALRIIMNNKLGIVHSIDHALNFCKVDSWIITFLSQNFACLLFPFLPLVIFFFLMEFFLNEIVQSFNNLWNPIPMVKGGVSPGNFVRGYVDDKFYATLDMFEWKVNPKLSRFQWSSKYFASWHHGQKRSLDKLPTQSASKSQAFNVSFQTDTSLNRPLWNQLTRSWSLS